jgi:hypothetical protein
MKTAIRGNGFWKLIPALTVVLALLLMATTAQAVTKYWGGPNPTTLWSNSNNWSLTFGGPGGAVAPSSTEDAAHTQNDGATRTVDLDVTSTIVSPTIDAVGFRHKGYDVVTAPTWRWPNMGCQRTSG